MNRTLFERRIYQNWADRFRSPRESFGQPVSVFVSEPKFAGLNLIGIWYIGKCSIVQFDPAYTEQVEEIHTSAGNNTALTGDTFQMAWGLESIQSRDMGLVHYLYPADLPDFLPSQNFTFRQLTLDDADLMAALHQANTPEDVDEGYVEVDHEIAFGCFADHQLVAAASGYQQTGFMDIGVLTHPAFRRQRLGKAVVGQPVNGQLPKISFPNIATMWRISAPTTSPNP